MIPTNLNVKASKGIETALIIAVLAIVGIIAYSMYKAGKLFNGIFDGVGGAIDSGKGLVGQSKQDAAIEALVEDAVNKAVSAGADSPLNAEWRTTRSGKAMQLLSFDTAMGIVQAIKTGSTDVAVSALKKCQYQSQVSQVAGLFKQEYKIDMLPYMRKNFDTVFSHLSNMKKLLSIIDFAINLPSGIKDGTKVVNGFTAYINHIKKALGGNTQAIQKVNETLAKNGQPTIPLKGNSINPAQRKPVKRKAIKKPLNKTVKK